MRPLPFDSKVLKSLVTQSRHLNIAPLFFNHWYPGEEKHPVSRILRRLIPEGIEYLRIMDEKELEAFLQSFHPTYWSLLGGPKATDNFSDSDLQKIVLYHLCAILEDDVFTLRFCLEPDSGKNFITETYPELTAKFDDEGLLVLDDKSLHLTDFGISYREHILHYHQFLRRGFFSNPNIDFLSRFIEYTKDLKGLATFRIAVDTSRICRKEDLRQMLEFDDWIGPRFEIATLDDPNTVGLTCIYRERPSIFDLTQKTQRTEFLWTYRSGIKSLQIEELSEELLRGAFYANRCVHLERDVERATTRHFDGAVRIYRKEDYATRQNSDLTTAPRPFQKTKVFRVDGDIDFKICMDLTTFFYKNNEMIVRYFDPSIYEEQLKPLNEGFG